MGDRVPDGLAGSVCHKVRRAEDVLRLLVDHPSAPFGKCFGIDEDTLRSGLKEDREHQGAEQEGQSCFHILYYLTAIVQV